MEPRRLIIFDYSGTLSRHAPEFSRPDHLTRQLFRSGLSGFGIDRPEIFWADIVTPTWEEGSTTSVGYIPLMARQIEKRQRLKSDGKLDRKGLYRAAAVFVRRYLEYSIIDRRWAALLTKLVRTPEATTVIATDHYAEATDAILSHLQKMKIAGAAIRGSSGPDSVIGNMVVANSADLGVRKADVRFWEILRTRLLLDGLQRILIVDDFGAREQTGDDYGLSEQVALRRQRTLHAIGSIFPIDIDVADICASSPSPRHDDDIVIQDAIRKIENFLRAR